ncbi:SH3 domain-containing protein [Gammaproteobacteria bacterium]|nr:SH3 domain-containing protein [Gammaproteobacteria bacterium]
MAFVLSLSAAPRVSAQTYTEGLSAYQSLDFSRAFDIWSELADAGDRAALYSLGVMYYTARGVPRDPKRSLDFFRKAAALGDRDSQFNVGVAYWTGEGAETDRQEAINWWQQAAEGGLADAQYNLGVAYYEGIGVDQDLTLARDWINKAAVQGHKLAEQSLDEISNELKVAEQQPDVAESVAEVDSVPAARVPDPEPEPEPKPQPKPVSAPVAEVTPQPVTPPKAESPSQGEPRIADAAAPSAVANAVGIGQRVVAVSSNIRMRPERGSSLGFHRMSQSVPYQVLQESGDWIKIGGGDITGYVYGTYVVVDGAVGTVTGKNVRVRPLPSTSPDAIPLGQLNAGQKLPVVAEEGEWVKTRIPPPLGGWVRRNEVVVR